MGEEQRGNGRRTEEREEHIEKHLCRIRRKREWIYPEPDGGEEEEMRNQEKESENGKSVSDAGK